MPEMTISADRSLFLRVVDRTQPGGCKTLDVYVDRSPMTEELEVTLGKDVKLDIADTNEFNMVAERAGTEVVYDADFAGRDPDFGHVNVPVDSVKTVIRDYAIASFTKGENNA